MTIAGLNESTYILWALSALALSAIVSSLTANLRTEDFSATAWAAAAFSAAALVAAILAALPSIAFLAASALSTSASSAVALSADAFPLAAAAALSAVALSRAALTVAALSRAARRLRSWRRSWLGVFLLQEGGGGKLKVVVQRMKAALLVGNAGDQDDPTWQKNLSEGFHLHMTIQAWQCRPSSSVWQAARNFPTQAQDLSSWAAIFTHKGHIKILSNKASSLESSLHFGCKSEVFKMLLPWKKLSEVLSCWRFYDDDIVITMNNSVEPV